MALKIDSDPPRYGPDAVTDEEFQRWLREALGLDELPAQEHPGHGSQKVHGRRRGGGSVVEDWEQAHRRDGVESGLIIYADGTTEEFTSGYREALQLSARQLQNLKGATFTHNHPINGSPLSWSDIAIAVMADAAEIRSISKDGWVSSFKAPGGSWTNAKGGIDGAYKVAVEPSVVFGTIRANTQKEVNQLLNDHSRKMADEVGGTYTFEKVK